MTDTPIEAELRRLLAEHPPADDRLAAEALDRPLEAAVARVGAALVVVDPLMAVLAATVESYRDHHVRRALAPLTALAERTGVALVAVRHLTKAGPANAKLRGGGSTAFTAAARSVMLAAVDPDDAGRRVLARTKGNLGPPWPSLSYRLLPAGETVRVEWGAETAHTADGLLAAAAAAGVEDGEERSARDEAADVLRAILADGPVASRDARRQARADGVADRTLDRARVRLGVRARRVGFGGGGEWSWGLPADDDPDGAGPEVVP